MGYIRHHAIVVTGYDGEPFRVEKRITYAHAKARELFERGATEGVVTDLSRPMTNGYRSFAILPDGSKEGWAESAEGDDRRAAFVRWLREDARKDGEGGYFAWAELQYGDDYRETKIIAHSDEAEATA